MEFNYSGYDIDFIQRKNIKDDSDHLFSFIYKFYSPKTGLIYVLTADYHKNDFFAIKFYPKAYRKSDRKYSLVVNRGDIGNIVITCLKLIPELLSQYPLSSFGFVGARTHERLSDRIEPLQKTKRFKLYSYVAQLKVGNETFQHFEYPDISGYLLVNKHRDDSVDKTEVILKKMLSSTYSNLPETL